MYQSVDELRLEVQKRVKEETGVEHRLYYLEGGMGLYKFGSVDDNSFTVTANWTPLQPLKITVHK